MHYQATQRKRIKQWRMQLKTELEILTQFSSKPQDTFSRNWGRVSRSQGLVFVGQLKIGAIMLYRCNFLYVWYGPWNALMRHPNRNCPAGLLKAPILMFWAKQRAVAFDEKSLNKHTLQGSHLCHTLWISFCLPVSPMLLLHLFLLTEVPIKLYNLPYNHCSIDWHFLYLQS